MLELIPKKLVTLSVIILGASYSLSFFGLLNVYSISLIMLCYLVLQHKYLFALIKKIPNFVKRNPYISLLALLIVIPAAWSPPTTTDALNYHLVRVFHWSESGSILSTISLSEHDYMPKMGSLLQLWAYTIGNDWLTWLPQYTAWIGVSIVGYLTLQKLLPKKIKYLAKSCTIILLTTPMAVLQASSTQIDLVVSFYFVTAFYFTVLFILEKKRAHFLFATVSFCLAVLTKPTALLFLPLFIALLPLFSYAQVKKVVVGASIVSFSLLSPWLLENYIQFSTVLPTQHQSEKRISYFVEEINAGSVLLATIKNTALQVPVPAVTQTNSYLQKFGEFVGQDVHDQKQNFNNELFTFRAVIYPQEDVASNPIQFLIIVIALCFLLYVLGNKKIKAETNLQFAISRNTLLGGLLSFVTFASVLRWQPWHSRLHLPLLLVLTIVACTYLVKYPKMLLVIKNVSIALAIILVISNTSKPYFDYALIEKHVSAFSTETKSLPKSFWTRERLPTYFVADPKLFSEYTLLVRNFSDQDVCEIPINLRMRFGLYKIIQNTPNLHCEIIPSTH